MVESASLLKRGGIFMCGYSCMEKLKLHKNYYCLVAAKNLYENRMGPVIQLN